MAQLVLAPEMLDAQLDARLDPLRRRPLDALGSSPCVVLDALPEPFAHLAVQGDERRPDIASRASFCYESERRLASLARTPSRSNSPMA